MGQVYQVPKGKVIVPYLGNRENWTTPPEECGEMLSHATSVSVVQTHSEASHLLGLFPLCGQQPSWAHVFSYQALINGSTDIPAGPPPLPQTHVAYTLPRPHTLSQPTYFRVLFSTQLLQESKVGKAAPKSRDGETGIAQGPKLGAFPSELRGLGPALEEKQLGIQDPLPLPAISPQSRVVVRMERD